MEKLRDSNKRLYWVWHAMKKRCENKTHPQYKNYGGRGIRLCREWHDFRNFSEWARKNGYALGLSIDRVDVNSDYHPNNCRWISLSEQNMNKRSNHKITFRGQTKPIGEWAEIFGLNSQTLWSRINHGWDEEKALLTPVNPNLRRNTITHSRPVVCLDTGESFPSAAAAGLWLGVNNSSIIRACKHKQNTVHGFQFQYQDTHKPTKGGDEG